MMIQKIKQFILNKYFFLFIISFFILFYVYIIFLIDCLTLESKIYYIYTTFPFKNFLHSKILFLSYNYCTDNNFILEIHEIKMILNNISIYDEYLNIRDILEAKNLEKIEKNKNIFLFLYDYNKPLSQLILKNFCKVILSFTFYYFTSISIPIKISLNEFFN